jgi:hypothetical protein
MGGIMFRREMKMASILAGSILLLTATASVAFAQLDAGAKLRGDYGYTGARHSVQGAGTRIGHAREYTQQLYTYAQGCPTGTLQPPIVKQESEQIGNTIQAARQNLDSVKKVAATAKDEDILKRIESIDKHLVAAADHHKMLHMECCKDEAGNEAIGNCCSDLMTELDKALAEHAALIRQLKPKAPVKPAG